MSSLLIVLPALFWTGPADMDRLIQKHDDHLSQIFSISATVVGRLSEDGGQTWKPMYEMEVRRSGLNEREHMKTYGRMIAGQWRNREGYKDVGCTAADTKRMAGLDPNNPPKLASGKQATGLSGSILAPMAIGPHGRNLEWTRLLMFTVDGDYSLRQLYGVSPVRSVTEGKDDAGGKQWDLHLRRRDGRFDYVVTLSERHHYLISRIVSRYHDLEKPHAKPEVTTRYVSEFTDVTPSLSLPRLIRAETDFRPSEVTEVEIKDVKINQPIPESEVAFDFPPGTIVNDSTKQKYYIWGEGKPDVVFASNEDFVRWNHERMRSLEAAHRPISLLPWVIVVSVTTIALVVLLVFRHKIRAALRSNPDAAV